MQIDRNVARRAVASPRASIGIGLLYSPRPFYCQSLPQVLLSPQHFSTWLLSPCLRYLVVVTPPPLLQRKTLFPPPPHAALRPSDPNLVLPARNRRETDVDVNSALLSGSVVSTASRAHCNQGDYPPVLRQGRHPAWARLWVLLLQRPRCRDYPGCSALGTHLVYTAARRHDRNSRHQSIRHTRPRAPSLLFAAATDRVACIPCGMSWAPRQRILLPLGTDELLAAVARLAPSSGIRPRVIMGRAPDECRAW
ncbi:hypothetical protein L226DRAFT_277523 [Lentinus tigrinus ALCF2SS1-7]|uniref:Uncharacterized protein n=1 Tax=Lentinus tigrinus ALCF2SS1-6 TaxID=1328759 RepID=A0A5C2RVA7_9APHY|nr:hypothetical protein L227DRAFT_348895 [Lentinus tigrinus ALCF2SS1-6]RPD69392.1 hypothetical protein L226DRAFT_277523 [Lentinus tigrinus ALCF2SS1-7]